eukprot:TRINITY_DN70146_c0_g1_i1.p2 TRINITY_DN70146_c0_g1~~TRINITY_DN70146_c0_g1_i1.p2  ORF type:complete len:123 (-),score=19.02 TRINITY_DN70146_c0_g1_i1:46-414(-)
MPAESASEKDDEQAALASASWDTASEATDPEMPELVPLPVDEFDGEDYAGRAADRLLASGNIFGNSDLPEAIGGTGSTGGSRGSSSDSASAPCCGPASKSTGDKGDPPATTRDGGHTGGIGL